MLKLLRLKQNILHNYKEISKTEKVLRCCSFISFAIMLIAQIVLLFTFDGPQISDSHTYVSLAHNVASENTWYPSKSLLSLPFFFGNGYVNLIALFVRFTDSLIPLFVLNIIFIQIILWSSVYIIKNYFNTTHAQYIFIILFCLLNTFWSEIVQIRTEIPFTAPAFLAIALICKKEKKFPIFAGVLLALANWVRPLGIAFLLGCIVLIILQHKKIANVLKIAFSYIVTLVLIGTFTFSVCGHFVYQSTTLGCNLLMSANDEADGSYMDVTGEGKVGYIPKEQKEQMIFKDYDKYYKDLSIDWILKNPDKYIMQIPKKLFYLYATETYSGSSYFNNKTITGGIDYIKSIYDKITSQTDEKLSFADLLIIFNQLWYMIILALFIIGVFLSLKKWRWVNMLPFYLPMLMGTGISLIIVGGARYHFPYLPTMIIGASLTIEYFLKRKKNNVNS